MFIAGRNAGNTGVDGVVRVTGLGSDGLIVEHAAFLRRETTLGRALPEVSLWPRESGNGLDEQATLDLVYGGGIHRMFGLARSVSVVGVVPEGEIAEDAEAREQLVRATGILSVATGGRPTFRVASPGEAVDVRVLARVEPGAELTRTGAGADRQMTGYTITGGALLFQGLRNARSLGVVLHELGHMFGLEHSKGAEDLMAPGPGGKTGFSDREKLAIRLMNLRLPGNGFPDSDSVLSGTSGLRTRLGVRCAGTP